MKIVRFAEKQASKWGIIEGDIVRSIAGSHFDNFAGPGGAYEFDGGSSRLDQIKLLPPCLPSKIVCVGMNHWSMVTKEITPHEIPIIFLTPTTALIATNESIEFPAAFNNVGFEGELAVVVGRAAKDVPKEKAMEYILGYTCHNDVSDYDAIRQDGMSFTRGKARDTFAPLGPVLVTPDENE